MGGPSAVEGTAYETLKELLSMERGDVKSSVQELKGQERLYVYRQGGQFLLAVFGVNKKDYLLVPFETVLERPLAVNAVYLVRDKREKYKV